MKNTIPTQINQRESLFVEVFNRSPKQIRAAKEVLDLHGFVRVVRAVLIGNEDHGDRDAGIARTAESLAARSKVHDGDAVLSGS